MKFGYTIAGFEGVNTLVESGINYAKNDLESIQARLDAETYEIAMFESLSEFKKYEIESTIVSGYYGMEDGTITDKVTGSQDTEAKTGTDSPWYKRLWEKIKAMFKAIGEFFMAFFRWVGRKLGILKQGIKTKFILFLARHTWAKKAIDFILRKKPNGDATDADVNEAVEQTEKEITKEIQAQRAGFESAEFMGFEGMEIWKKISGFFGKLKTNVVNYVKGLVNRYKNPTDLKRAAGATRIAKIMYTNTTAKPQDMFGILDKVNITSGGNLNTLVAYLRSYLTVIATVQQDESVAKELASGSSYENEAYVEQTIVTAKKVLSYSDEKLFSVQYVEMAHENIYETYSNCEFEYMQRFLDKFNELANTFSKNFESTYKYVKDILERKDAADSEFLKGFLENREPAERLEKTREILGLLRDCGNKLSNISKKLIAAGSEIENFINNEEKDMPEKIAMSAGEI